MSIIKHSIKRDGGAIIITRTAHLDLKEFAETMRKVQGFANMSDDVAASYAHHLANTCPSVFDDYHTDDEYLEWHASSLADNYPDFLESARPVFETLACMAGHDEAEAARLFEELKRRPIEGWATNLCDPNMPTGKHMLRALEWADFMDEHLRNSVPGH